MLPGPSMENIWARATVSYPLGEYIIYDVIPMGILRGAYSVSGFLQHVTDIPDPQLDPSTS